MHQSSLARALTDLRRFGLLMESDATFPSVAAIVAGGPVKGSWWGHPKTHAIWAVINGVADSPDALACRLISGKATFVHRRLWPALAAIGRAGAAWQTRGLTAAARALLRRVDKEREVETSGDAARELEKRLLAVGRQFHTEEGHHEKRLVSWDRAVGRLGKAKEPEALLESAAEAASPGAAARLPWNATPPRAARRSRSSASSPARRGSAR